MGGAVKKVSDAMPGNITTKALGMGSLSDNILGKKQKGKKDSYVPLDPIQLKAIKKYDKMLDINPELEAKSQVAANERQIMANAADAERFAKDTVAQRGLGGSAAGLSSIINTRRNIGRDISANRAMLPGLKNQLSTQNLLNATQGIQSIFNNRIFKQGTPGGQRVGGLAPLIGAGIGGAFGGVGGAQVGMGVGNAITQTA